MDRQTINTLLVDDNDFECKTARSKVTLDDIKMSNIGFIASDLEKYPVIIYKGRLGKKALKLDI